MENRLDGLLELFQKDPKDPFVMYGIALEYMSNKNYEKAEEFFKAIFKVDDKYLPAYMQYAQLKTNLDEIEEAKNLYKTGIKIAEEKGEIRMANEMEDFLDELN